MIYLNRLSDLLFVWSRRANQREGIAEVRWVRESATGSGTD